MRRRHSSTVPFSGWGAWAVQYVCAVAINGPKYVALKLVQCVLGGRRR